MSNDSKAASKGEQRMGSRRVMGKQPSGVKQGWKKTYREDEQVREDSRE